MIPDHDKPKLLGNPAAKAARLLQLFDPNLKPLTNFVEDLRKEIGPEASIPFFDPWDGGIAAEILFLLEAPGAKAVGSGFISRNNPDETAKNFFKLNVETGIPRGRTITWNIVPWYIGSGTRIRPAAKKDIDAGLTTLNRLFSLLPKLRGVVLIGRKAERAEEHCLEMQPNLKIFKSPHPSPMFINRSPNNRSKILTVFRDVSTFLGAATKS